MATLKRYKRHYRLKTRQNVTKTELALAVAKHFASQHVDEVRLPCRRFSPAGLHAPRALDARAQAETIQLFVYSARSGTLQYGAEPWGPVVVASSPRTRERPLQTRAPAPRHPLPRRRLACLMRPSARWPRTRHAPTPRVAFWRADRRDYLNGR